MKPAIPTPNPSAPLSNARLARMPRAGLAALAALRGRMDVIVHPTDEGIAWISWEPAGRGERDEVVEALLPVPGAMFFRWEEGRWYRVGRRLPEFDGGPPGAEGMILGLPLHRALVPEPVHWVPPVGGVGPVRLELARDETPRPASAMIAMARSLLSWAESAPTARLESLRVARSGDRVLLIGQRLPPIVGAGRFWGHRVLVPLGFRAEPDLPEPRLVEAMGMADDAIGLIGLDGRVEIVPAGVLAPLSRSSARRMAGVDDRLGPPGERPRGVGKR